VNCCHPVAYMRMIGKALLTAMSVDLIFVFITRCDLFT
jgi:hypothetical protein